MGRWQILAYLFLLRIKMNRLEEQQQASSKILPIRLRYRPTATSTTTWLIPWMWYYASTSTLMNVELHSDAEKAQHAAAAAAGEREKQRAMHRHADADIEDLQRDSPPSGTQTNATGGFFFFFGCHYHHHPGPLLAKRLPRTTVTDSRSIDISGPGPESCRIDYDITHFQLSFVFQFSSRSLMVKTLGYESALVGLIEDSAR